MVVQDAYAVALAGSRDDDLLGAARKVDARGLGRDVLARALDDDIDAQFLPGVFVVLGLDDKDLLSVDDHVVALGRHGAVEAAVHRVILEQIRRLLDRSAVAGDGDYLEQALLVVLEHRSKDQTADTAKTADCNLDFAHRKDAS